MAIVLNKNKKLVPIGRIMGRTPVTGLVGLEIEVEGVRLPGVTKNFPSSLNGIWTQHNDGSLRGEENREYVFKRPLSFPAAHAAVDDLWGAFQSCGSVLDDSNRTSVHVHVNVQDWYLPQLASFGLLYFSLEELLSEWCGANRVGNLFCLRAKDAEEIVHVFTRFIQKEGAVPLSDSLHYGGLNLHALAKFGSLEVRLMRGATEANEVHNWLTIIERLYRLAEKTKDPRLILENFSRGGPEAYLEYCLGPLRDSFLEVVQRVMSAESVRDSLYEGVRRVQQLGYALQWEEYETVKLDPFGRMVSEEPVLASATPPPIPAHTLNNNFFAPSSDGVIITNPVSPVTLSGAYLNELTFDVYDEAPPETAFNTIS